MFQSFAEYAKTSAINKKLIDQYGKIKVYEVNGRAVRTSSKEAQEFGASSTHAALPKTVPENEIWIEDDVPPNERKVMIASSLYQIAHTRKGMAYKKAYDLGIAKEKDYRESEFSSKKEPWKTDEPVDKSIYLKKYGHIKNESIDVWLVSGEKVRNKYKTDFIEGGHGYVYKWVPNNEIWIEFGPHTEEEAPFIILHEYLERILMKYRKMEYDKAHWIAARHEWEERENLKGFSKQDALSLTKDKIFTMLKKNE